MIKSNYSIYFVDSENFEELFKTIKGIAHSIQVDSNKLNYYLEVQKDFEYIIKRYNEFIHYLEEYEGYCDNLKIFLEQVLRKSNEFYCEELTIYLQSYFSNWMERLTDKPFKNKEVETNSFTVKMVEGRVRRRMQGIVKILEYVTNEISYYKNLLPSRDNTIKINENEIATVQWRGDVKKLEVLISNLIDDGFITVEDKNNFLKLVNFYWLDKLGNKISIKKTE